ncbi:YggS family pyridoxal phosphate-dependent enzyme [Virgibacillus halophilus]|uniref:YggS family pyridoxal phosphate-dependent enzyme n=1 Tax=Tigheibacillus halophilus TaxID=361280 RepID=UPI00362A8B81
MEVATNLANIRSRIEAACDRSNRNKEDIVIIGVTKYVTIERTEETINAGIKNLGENRLEGFLDKYQHFQDEDVCWHFIGSLQTRKVKDVIDKVDMVHSLDRMSLAKEINKRIDRPVDCFIQVNVSGEESKHGLMKEELMQFIADIRQYEHVRIAGLMTMAPLTENEQVIRNVFRELRELRDAVKEQGHSHAPCRFLSMGMSNDYEIAIEEGATHIRIGTDLVG